MMSNTYSLVISRNSNQEINLQVRDNLSRVQFLELKLTLEQFASAVTGLSLDTVTGEVRDLESVGKTKIRESRCVKIPESMWNKSNSHIRQWLIDEFKEGGEIYEPGGWKLDSYASKRGASSVDYWVYKYVEAQE